jgi:hypothetical protein
MADQPNEFTVEINGLEEQNIAVLEEGPYVVAYPEAPELMQRKPLTIGFRQEPLVIVIEEEATIVGFGEAGTPGPTGPQGPPGPSGGAATEIEIYPFDDGTTEVVDSASVSYRGIDWLVTVRDIVGGKTQSWHVHAVNDGSSAEFTVSNKVFVPKTGGKLDVDTDVTINAGNVRLELTNNSGITLKISAVRYGMIMT